MRARRPGRPGRPIGEDDVVAFQGFEAAVQDLQDRLSIFLIVGFDLDQLAADRHGLAKLARIEVNGQLRTLCRRVLRIECGSAAEGVGRLVKAGEAIQQVAAMQMVLCGIGGECQGALDRIQRWFRPPPQHFGCRQQPVTDRVGLVDDQRRRYQFRRLVEPVAAQQQLGRVMGVGALGRHQRMGAQCQVDGSLPVPNRECRPRQMA